MDRGVADFPVRNADRRAADDVPFFKDWVDHPERDAYWDDIDGDRRPETLRAPVLLMAGWYDPFLPGQLDDFTRIRRGARSEIASASRLVIGPWAHATTVSLPSGDKPRNYRLESLAPSLAWFDRHLRSAPAPPSDPPVRIFVMGLNVWPDEQEWPLARARYIPWFLGSRGHANTRRGDGVLSPSMPTATEPPDHYVYDPRDPVRSAGGAVLGDRSGVARQDDVELRSDVLVYATAPLADDLEVTGPIRVVLHVATSAPSTDFTAKLVDVHPDGAAYNVSDGIVRRRYDGAPTEIAIDLWPTSIVFRRGHRLRFEVSSSNFPRYDRNPNTGRSAATETEPVAARQTVWHGADKPSRLILPVVPPQR